MLINVEFWNKEKYLPTKRHRILRERYVKNCVDVEIKEVTEQGFPIAFLVKDYGWRFDEETEYGMFSTEIRTYNGKLWKAVRYSECVSHGAGWMPVSYIKNRLEEYAPFWKGGQDFTEKSIIKEDDLLECKEGILRKAEDYIIFDGKVWNTCGEPMYVINTFGLGHNHGGTGFFIEYNYNPNISKNNYFNALEREEAIAYGKKVAANRGDTDSIEGMGELERIWNYKDFVTLQKGNEMNRNEEMKKAIYDIEWDIIHKLPDYEDSKRKRGIRKIKEFLQKHEYDTDAIEGINDDFCHGFDAAKRIILDMCKNKLKKYNKHLNEDWIPVSSGVLPDDKENVQVTYLGYYDKIPYCEAFAYRDKGSWYWSLDDSDVVVEITAWKYNCKPYDCK